MSGDLLLVKVQPEATVADDAHDILLSLARGAVYAEVAKTEAATRALSCDWRQKVIPRSARVNLRIAVEPTEKKRPRHVTWSQLVTYTLRLTRTRFHPW